MKDFGEFIDKYVRQFWCIELMRRTGCFTPGGLQRVIDNLVDSQKNRASNKYYKYFSGAHSPRENTLTKCEINVPDSQWLFRNVLWDVLRHETLSEEQAYSYFSKLSNRYLNRLSGDWWLGTNFYRDSFTDKILRYVTLDSLAILVILIKLARQKGEFILEARIARQLYRGLLIIGAHIPNIKKLRLAFFFIFRVTIFNKIDWFRTSKHILNFELYQFGVRTLNNAYPIMPNLGLTLNAVDKRMHVYERSTFLFKTLWYSPFISLNLFPLPPRTDVKTLNDWDRVYTEIQIRLEDLCEMHYSFNDVFTSKYIDNHELHETAKFIRKHAPYRPSVKPSQRMVDKLFPDIEPAI